MLIGLIAGLIVVAERARSSSGAFASTIRSARLSVHGICGIWGALALGLFADGTYGDGWNGVAGPVRGLLYGDSGQFVAQLIGVTVNIVVVFGLSFGLFSSLIEHRSEIACTPKSNGAGSTRWRWAAKPIRTLSRRLHEGADRGRADNGSSRSKAETDARKGVLTTRRIPQRETQLN